MSKGVIWVVLLAVLLLGCNSATPAYTPPPTAPDIRASSLNTEKSFSLSQGAVATGSYTLTNYGDADGTAVVSLEGDASGPLKQETVFVRAKDSVTQTVNLDIRNQDTQVIAKVVAQQKVG